ncbi:MAG: hypothetical protein R2875_14550 [Desulfobacterales bacterium]
MAMAAFLVTFFSASQDIVADAYRREDIPDAELRIRLITVYQRIPDRHAAGRRRRLILADHIPFSAVYLIMAGCLLPDHHTRWHRSRQSTDVPPQPCARRLSIR